MPNYRLVWKVLLASLLMKNSDVLLLDEPTNNLDPETQLIVGDVFKTFNGSMIVVSHNIEFVKNLGIERVLILPSGKIDYYSDEIVNHYHELEMKRIKQIKWSEITSDLF